MYGCSAPSAVGSDVCPRSRRGVRGAKAQVDDAKSEVCPRLDKIVRGWQKLGYTSLQIAKLGIIGQLV